MGNENEGPKTLEEAIKVLGESKTQIDNLNKGIATYRDEAKTAKEEAKTAVETAKTAQAAVEEFKKLLDKKDDGIKLTATEEEKFAAFAKKNGLVSQADMDKARGETFAANLKEVENNAVAEFLEQHPEYDDDEKWKEVLSQFGLYKQPTSLPAYRALLNRIYKDLNPADSKDARAKARAEIITRGKLGLGGGSQKTGADEAEAEVDEMLKKYPNLSREQIEARLAEVRSLPNLNKKK